MVLVDVMIKIEIVEFNLKMFNVNNLYGGCAHAFNLIKIIVDFKEMILKSMILT